MTIKNIEKELICPACKELFTHPLILPCQHSVCHKCVKELLLSLDDSFNDVASDNSNQSSPRLRLTSPSMDKIDKISRPGMWESLADVPYVGQGELIDRGSVITVEGKLLLLVSPLSEQVKTNPPFKTSKWTFIF